MEISHRNKCKIFEAQGPVKMNPTPNPHTNRPFENLSEPLQQNVESKSQFNLHWEILVSSY